MPTFQELERAFLNAHKAGDRAAASALASEIRKFGVIEEPAAPQEAPDDSSDLVRGFTSYLPQTKETIGGAQVLAGKAIGSEDMIKSGIERMNAAKAELATKHKASDSFTKALDKGVGTVLTDWLPYQIGSGAANLLESLAVMTAGSVVGSVVAPGLGTVAGGTTGFVEKELVKRGIKEAAEKIIKEQGEEAGKRFFEEQTKTVVKDIAKSVAGKTALAAQAGVHGAGETTSRAMEEAERLGKDAADIEMERVLPAALVHGVAEYFGDKIGLGAWKNINEDAKTGLINFIGSLIKNTAVTGTKEAPIEVIQSAAERYGAKLSLDDAQAVKEYIDSAAAAYGMSVVPAAGSTVRSYADAIDRDLAQRAAEQQALSDKAQEEAAQITTTAVPDETGVVPATNVQSDIQFSQRAPGSIGAPAPAPTPDAVPDIDPTIALTEAAPAPTALPSEVIEAAYAANNVSTEKVRQALEPQLIEMGLETKKAQTAYLAAERDRLGIPAFDRKDSAKSEQAKQEWLSGYNTKLEQEAANVAQPAGIDTTGAQPSIVSPASELGAPPTGTETSGPAGVVPTGGPATTTPVAEGAQPAALKEEKSEPNIVRELALEEQRQAGWNPNWPFVPADLGNADFRKLIVEDPNLTQDEKNQIFEAGKKLNIVPKDETATPPTEITDVTETTEAKQTKTQRQKQAAAPKLTNEQLSELYEEDAAITRAMGFDTPSWESLSKKEKEEVLPALIEIAKTKGMLPAKGEGKQRIPLHLYKLILNRLNKKAAEAAKTGEKDATPKWVVEGYGANRGQWEMDNNQIGDTVRWNALTPDERAIFNGAIINGTPGEFKTAFDALYNYRSVKAVSPVKDQKGPESGASYYELNRAAYNRDMPEWSNLTPAEKEAFLKEIKPEGKFATAGQKHQRVVTVEQMDAGFKAATALINKRLEKQAAEKTKAEEEQKGKAQRVAKEEAAIAAEEVEVGKELPTLVKMMLGEGGVNNVLAYIAKKAQGLNFGKMTRKALRARTYGSASLRDLETRHGALTRAIFKNVAASLMRINFSKSQVVVDPNNAVIKQLQREGKLAAYDPKTDTFYFTRDGMDEMTVLHEIVHAGTIKILYAFKTNPNSLTREQREAAEQINKVYEFAKGKLSEKYPNQMENVYEFVSYALTDPTFQAELARTQAPSLAKYTLPPSGAPSGFNFQSVWSHLTKAMMKLYGLTKAVARFFEIKPQFYEILTSGGYEQEPLLMGGRGAKEVETQVKNYLDGIREKEVIDKETIITFEAVSNLRDKAESKLKNKYPDVFKDDTDQGVLDFASKCVSDKNFAEQVQEAAGFGTTYAQAKVGITKQAGFQGNALIEVTQAFQDILAAPEAGIDLEALPAKKPQQAKAPKQAPAVPTPTFDSIISSAPSSKKGNVKQAVKRLGFAKTSENLVKWFQNDRAAIKNWENRLRYTGRLMAYAAGFNNIYTQLTLSSGNAFHLYTEYAQANSDAIRQEILAYAKKYNLDIERATKELGAFAIALHEPERRKMLYLRTVPLLGGDKKAPAIPTLVDAKGNPITADAARNAIFAYLDSHKLDESGAKYLRAQLEAIVNDKANHDTKAPANEFDINDQKYAVAGYTTEEVDTIRKMYEKRKADVEPIIYNIKKLNKVVVDLNRMSNYMSEYADNYIMFYGFENYVPFKGKTFIEDKADMFNYDTRKIGGELQEQQHTFDGRISVPDNAVLQVMSDAAQAALRAGRRDVTQAIYNAVNDGTLAGKIMKFKDENGVERDYVSFADRKNDDLLQKLKGETKVFHYMPNGRVAIIEISDKAQREAIRRSYREINPLTDWLVSKGNLLTGFVGQMHTRYNVAFAPINFVRDVLTNSFTLGASLGPKATFQYLGAVASDVATGNLFRTNKFARLYARGDVAAINKLAQKDTYYRDLLDYMKLGGKVSFIQGIAPKGQYNELYKEVGGNVVLRTKEQVDKFFDAYIDSFELSARVSAYRVTKATETARLKKEDPTKSAKEIEYAASKTAAAYAKNLANFEQVGQFGKALGAFFMFFRPSATGAVRALEALAPLTQSVKRAKLGLPEFAEAAQIREKLAKGGMPEAEKKKLKDKLATLDKAVATFEKNYGSHRKSAAILSAALGGIGVVTYLMSASMADDDDAGRNKAAVDDMSRWTRNARFFVGENTVFQIPWGYGLGAFAAIGAQIAAMFNGNTRLVDSLGNVVTISLDSFLPLPISRIPPLEKPLPFVLDSLLPSVARPLFEYAINVDALGRQIYNNRQSRFGEAYTGGYNVPEAYKDAAIWVFETLGIDVSPNVLYFFANNFFDGASRVLHNANNTRLWLSGDKEFDAKTDLMVFDSFFGRESNIDAREWQRVENDLKERATTLKALENSAPDKYYEYVAKNPLEPYLVDMYEEDVNGTLRDLKAQANEINARKDFPPALRNDLLKNITLQTNLEKRRLIENYKMLGVEP